MARAQAFDVFKLIIVIILAIIGLMLGLHFLRLAPYQQELSVVNSTAQQVWK
ncbi:MAG: hypothetical protein GXO42_03080 [bacterium]|nr:hypothetical protein [bacterium]